MSFNPTYRLQNLQVQNLTTVNDLVINGSVSLPLMTGSNIGQIKLFFANDGLGGTTPVLSNVQVSSTISTGTPSFFSNPNTIVIPDLRPSFTWPVSIQCFGAGFDTAAVSSNPSLKYWNATQVLNLSNLRISYWPPSAPTYPNSILITNAELSNLGVENATNTQFATPGNNVLTAIINFNF